MCTAGREWFKGRGKKVFATPHPRDFPVTAGGFSLGWVTLAAPGTADRLSLVFIIITPMTFYWLKSGA